MYYRVSFPQGVFPRALRRCLTLSSTGGLSVLQAGRSCPLPPDPGGRHALCESAWLIRGLCSLKTPAPPEEKVSLSLCSSPLPAECVLLSLDGLSSSQLLTPEVRHCCCSSAVTFICCPPPPTLPHSPALSLPQWHFYCQFSSYLSLSCYLSFLPTFLYLCKLFSIYLCIFFPSFFRCPLSHFSL